ncbi:ABC transporter substrate-binding protein [Effusibacillus lacus]|uniref:Sugar ABC transporter substrate-binding protein n=1 Tax=Effusibacillus lacus TaxID=1348429 RepID=A0A292YKD6_9BACL|nr:ABC transporter substrate-binding protein [Effusibacillus lacus]TCS68569.1 putative ABC transport system substrate-binding protein [Effusibacillus lacus]GAX88844.1 sugar ABC transporter substrate-binding protein [Effusibacillus lacus]
MRKGLGLLLSGTLAFALAACGSNTGGQPAAKTSNGGSTAKQEKTISLGLTQFVEHPALDSVRKGIVDGLAEAGYQDGKNLVIDYQNAHGDMSNTVSIAQKFASDKKDIVVAIATPSAQAAAKTIQDKPVVFSAVTDPVSAQLVGSLDKPDKNVTGTSDKLSMDKQLELIQKFLPSLKKLGIIYTTSEVNSEVQVKEMEEAARKKGIEVFKAGITSSNEVQLAAQTLVDKAQAIFIPIDNTVVASVEGVLTPAQKAKIPVFASDIDTVKRGAVATYGIDYYKVGKQTGEMVARILKGQKVADTPVEVTREVNLTIHEKAAAAFGLTLSDELKNQAKEILK